MKKRNHLLLWLVLFPLLAIAAVYTVVSANQNFSTDIFLTYLSQVQPVWLAAGRGLHFMLHFLGRIEPAYHLPPLGQPLTPGARRRLVCSGYFLLCRHPLCNRWTAGLRLVHASGRCAGLCLLRSAASESGSLHPVHSGHRAHCHCTVPRVLATFCLPARWFIVVGAVLQLALAGLFLLLLVRPGLVERIALWCLNLLSRGRLRLRAEQWRAALAKKMPEYRACTQVLRRDWRLLAAAFCCNLLQRLSLLLVPVCLLLGSAGSPQQALRAAAIQACIILGSNAAPLPGAMGVADFLFLDGYGHLTQDPVSMELASRGISFYGCFLLCGLILLAGVLASGIYRKRENP